MKEIESERARREREQRCVRFWDIENEREGDSERDCMRKKYTDNRSWRDRK